MQLFPKIKSLSFITRYELLSEINKNILPLVGSSWGGTGKWLLVLYNVKIKWYTQCIKIKIRTFKIIF